MLRILCLLGLVFTCGLVSAASDDKIERHRAYFKKLDLPYVEARGCNADTPCSLAADFNGDGQPDLASLYEYAGKQSRRNRWNLDLVIVYTQGDSSELKHEIFTNVGQIDSEARVKASLAIQEAGVMKVPAGQVILERPAINIVAGKNTDIIYYPTFYWREKTYYWPRQGFYSIDKSDD